MKQPKGDVKATHWPHIPLACGGADSTENMQWQTEEEPKAKDKWERADCEIYTSDVP